MSTKKLSLAVLDASAILVQGVGSALVNFIGSVKYMIVIQCPNKWNKQWSDNRKYHPNRACMAVIETEYQLTVKELSIS
ncbi:hypothetical protein BG005_001064 [Podila minutissima]|nr:hypothetical protein BG005_001064 [Podila minutissima]